MASMLHLVAIMVVGITSSAMPSENRAHHFMESRRESFGATIEGSEVSVRVVKSSKYIRDRKIAVVYPKLLNPTSFPTTFSPSSSNSRSYSVAVTPSTATDREMIDHDDIFGLIDYESVEYVTVSLQVFLLGMSLLMEEKSRNAFELAALKFIIDGFDQIDAPIESVGYVTVVDQRLTWTRIVEGESRIGLEVSFEAYVAFLGDIEHYQLEKAVQVLFDSKAKAFQRSFKLALRGPTKDEPKSETLLSMRVPLGLAATVAGFVGFMALVITSVCYVKKEKNDAKNCSNETSLEEENGDVVRRRLGAVPFSAYPVQEIAQARADEAGQQIFDSSESDVSTYGDNSFNASLNASLNSSVAFCPSVISIKEARGDSAIFDWDQSVIAMNIENATGTDDDETCKYSPVRQAAKRLSDRDLRDFDDMVRRAEC